MDALRLLLILSFISSSSAAVYNGEKLSLELYYETLCPACSNLMVNYLYKLVHSDLISITDLKLIPYGNARVNTTGTIICQHGPFECLLNTVEACAIDVWPDVKDHFPFIHCVESLVYHRNYTYWETCFEKLGLDASSVTDCCKGKRGVELELEYAAKTNALQPPHRYVPWVVVDGQPLYDDYRNFVSYICKAYKGTARPSACIESSIDGFIGKVKMNLSDHLYGDETSKSKLLVAVQAITN